MSTEIANQGGRSLSKDLVNSLLTGIAESRASTPIVGGKPLLRLLKSGQWVFGQSDDPVQKGSGWAVNPLSIMHGYCCWSDYPGNVKNQLLGEKMVPVSEPKPDHPQDTQGFPWKEQRTFDLKCIDGEDEGAEVFYKGASVGAMNAFDAFAAKLIKQLQTDPSHPVPVITLDVDSYQHTKWGLTYVPVFTVVGWATMAGELVEIDNGGDDAEPVPGQPSNPVPTPTPQPAPTPQPTPQPAPTTPPAAAAAATTKPPLAARAGAAPRRQRPVERA